MADTLETPTRDAGQAQGIRQINSTPAFASRIDTYVVPDSETLNAQLLEAVAALQAEDNGIKASNQLGWHSRRDFFAREEPAFLILREHIRSALAHSVRRYWKKFDPVLHKTSCDGWINVNGMGGFNTPHDHAIHDLSGCYYVSTPQSQGDAGGMIEFLNPIGAYSPARPFSELLMQRRITARPKAGHMLIFPSYLVHWVYPNRRDEERVTVAFNLSVLEPKESIIADQLPPS
ncbi:MAG: TIGR02466 family protein [Novosphingobium sp.]|nr:hypothetical protein [Novosphingobium sp.]